MSKTSKDTLTYSLVFALGYFVACSSTNTTRGNVNPPPSTSGRMLNSTVRNTAIFPTNTGTQPVLASIFGIGSRVHADATIADPSQLAQSFESVCSGWGSGSNSQSIHAAYGKSGLVSLNFGSAGIGPGDLCEEGPIASVGADENGNPTGFPIILSGTINSLAVYGLFVSGNRFRCLDTTDTNSLQDNSSVRAYYDLAHDAIVMGSGTTQLSVTCSVSVPAGDDVAQIQVQWIKS